MTSKTHRRNFLKSSIGIFAAGQGAGLLAGPAQQKNAAAPPQQPRNEAARANLFPGFKSMRINTSGATINAVVGGSGPPVIMLHGYPQTHVMWHKVAPALAERFTIVAADLRGYGDSSKPPDGPNHSNYSKRAMAKDQMEVMSHLGLEKFAVVGHDKGSGVASRMALDYPDKVTKLAVFDTLPSPLMTYRNLTKEWAEGVYHWFLLVQPSPLPETLIGNSVEFYLRSRFERSPGAITPQAFAEYLRCFRDPATIHATCEDYRASAGVDLEIDNADWDKKISCPVLSIWAERGNRPPAFRNALDFWKQKSVNAKGKALRSGHFIAEEVPQETLTELRSFLI
jgi:haloacetate dehalogenase